MPLEVRRNIYQEYVATDSFARRELHKKYVTFRDSYSLFSLRCCISFSKNIFTRQVHVCFYVIFQDNNIKIIDYINNVAPLLAVLK